MNTEFLTFLKREIHRFLVLYKQTIVPALISSLLYIIVFGTTLGTRISSIDGVPYINYIVPGLAMMSVINQAYQNSASSIMQGKYLKFIEDSENPPTVKIEFFKEQKNIKNINCFSNEGGEWGNPKLKFSDNILQINFREKFNFRRGRVNCSLHDGNIWRWFGMQFSVKTN